MSRNRHHILTFILIILIITCGFVRDYLFRYINTLINPAENIEYAGNTVTGDLIKNFSQNGFYSLKWYFTFLFTFLYFFLSGLILYRLIRKKKYIWFMAGFYAFFMILSAILIMTGLISGNYPDFYRLSHSFIMILQSPVPLIIFVAASFLLRSPE